MQLASQTLIQMPTYTLFDRNGNIVNPKELQNRAVWYRRGMTREQAFVDCFGERLDVRINPQKQCTPTAPDLVFKNNLADLKCQETPLFVSNRYEIPPTFAVTFNLKDALQYGCWGKNYKSFSIFYWLDWVAVKMEMDGRIFVAQPLTGVWRVEFDRLEELRHTSKIHWYNQRHRHVEQDDRQRELLLKFEPRLKEGNHVWAIRGDGENAACSYVFDVRQFERVV